MINVIRDIRSWTDISSNVNMQNFQKINESDVVDTKSEICESGV